MTEKEIEDCARQLIADSRELGVSIDEQLAWEKAADIVAQAREHGVSVEAIRQRNLMRALFGGGVRPTPE